MTELMYFYGTRVLRQTNVSNTASRRLQYQAQLQLDCLSNAVTFHSERCFVKIRKNA